MSNISIILNEVIDNTNYKRIYELILSITSLLQYSNLINEDQ